LRHAVYFAKAALFAPLAAPAADVDVVAVVVLVEAADPAPPHAATARAVVRSSAATAPR
jgi:hypothetical protein